MPVEIGAAAALASLGRRCTPSTSAPVESIPLRKLRRLTFSIALARSLVGFTDWIGFTGCSIVLTRYLRGSSFYRRANPLIGPAAADIARHRVIDLLIAGAAVGSEQRHR